MTTGGVTLPRLAVSGSQTLLSCGCLAAGRTLSEVKVHERAAEKDEENETAVHRMSIPDQRIRHNRAQHSATDPISQDEMKSKNKQFHRQVPRCKIKQN